MQLSQHFTFEEMVRTEHRLYIDENLAAAQPFIGNLQRLCTEVLEPARDIMGMPVRIMSGFRCPGLNAAIGGQTKPPSRHMLGEAADCIFVGASVIEAFNRLAWHPGFAFGQIINEFGAWVHLSLIDEVRYPGATMQRLLAVRKEGTTKFMEAKQ